MAAEDAGHSHPAPGYLLEGQGERHHVGGHAAVFLGHGQPEQAHLPHHPDDLLRVAPGRLPLAGHRPDLLVDERAQRVAEEALLRGELEVHLAS